MIKPKVGISTCIMKGFNLGEEDSYDYQKKLGQPVQNWDLNP